MVGFPVRSSLEAVNASADFSHTSSRVIEVDRSHHGACIAPCARQRITEDANHRRADLAAPALSFGLDTDSLGSDAPSQLGNEVNPLVPRTPCDDDVIPHGCEEHFKEALKVPAAELAELAE